MAEVKPIRDKFNKPVGLILMDYANLSAEQNAALVDYQANLTAISIAEKSQDKKTNLFTLSAEDAATKASSVLAEIKTSALEIVNSGKGVPRDVPLLGELAVKQGYVAPELKNILLEAQSAERVMRALDNSQGNTGALVVGALNAGKMDDKMIHRPFISFESDASLKSAQSVNHLADILSAAIQKNPALANDEVIKNAQTAANELAGHIYSRAAQKLEGNGHTLVAKDIKEAVPDAKVLSNAEFDQRIQTLQKGASVAVKEIGLEPEQQAQLEALIITRAQDTKFASQGQGAENKAAQPNKAPAQRVR